MKKSLLWIVVMVLSVSMVAAFSLYGCKAEKAVAEEVAEEEAVVVEEEEEAEEAAPAEEEAIEKPYAGITVILYCNSSIIKLSGPGWDGFVKAVEDKTGIIVKGIPEPAEVGDLNTKLTALLSSNNDAFDIVHLDELLTVTYLRAGFLEPIDDVMTPDVVKLYPSDIIKNISMYDGKIYTAPTDLSPMYLFVNKKVFADAGIQYPKTQDEFMAAAKALTKNGMYGYGAAWGKGGYLYNDAIKWVADREALRHIDMFNESGITDRNLGLTTVDGLHPSSSVGYPLISKAIINELFTLYI